MVGSVGTSNSAFDYGMYAGSMMVDPESGEGMMIGEGGATQAVSPEVVAQTLEAAGMMIVGGKMVGTVDKLEISASSANAGLSVGAPPPLPMLGNTAPAGEVLSSTKMLQIESTYMSRSGPISGRAFGDKGFHEG